MCGKSRRLMASVPLSKDYFRTWWTVFFCVLGLWMGIWHTKFGLKLICAPDFANFGHFSPWFLRDGIASGRGVHRFWGVPIQKSRSLFGHFSRFFPIFWIFGVGVVYSGIPPVAGFEMDLKCENMWVGTVTFYCWDLDEFDIVFIRNIWALPGWFMGCVVILTMIYEAPYMYISVFVNIGLVWYRTSVYLGWFGRV